METQLRDALEMRSQLAERWQNHQFPRPRDYRFVLQLPGVLVRDIHRIQSYFHGWINITARAVTDHPALGLHNFVFVHQLAVSFMILFRHDLDKFEESLQSGALYLGR